MESDGISWWNEKVWVNILRKDVNIPSNFLPLFDMIIDNYGREIWQGSMNEEEDDYYRVSISFKVDQRLMIITSVITENGEEPASDDYTLNNNEDVNTFLDENNLDSIIIEYQGGGDDGYNEGAYGKITVTKEEIQIDHIWNTREDVDSDLRLVIKLEDVE